VAFAICLNSAVLVLFYECNTRLWRPLQAGNTSISIIIDNRLPTLAALCAIVIIVNNTSKNHFSICNAKQ
jgi:hypothetical protein